MYRHFSFRALGGLVLLFVMGFLTVSTVEGLPAQSYSVALRRYPYLTDVVGPYATINWATDRSEISGGVRYGKVGAESCTAHYVIATRTPISVNSVSQYQWKAQLTLEPGEQYCYRVYLGTSPSNEIDLLGSDASPTFWTQVPSGATQSYSFLVFGDWGQVDASGANPYQADVMSLIASSGARFAVTTGDNGYPSGSQKNFGDLIQVGDGISAIFGPSFWKVPGASLPIFLTQGNHGFASSDANHPYLLTWPQDRVVSTSGGRYVKETYCCLNGSNSAAYPSAWYALDAGVARFYMLQAAWSESNVGTASEYEMDYDYHWAPGTAQYEWLQADLAAHPSVLKFAFLHYPLYSDNPHEATDTFLLGSDGLEGLLKQHNVDIAFTGHAHIYERNFASADGVINYITGGGGATPGTLGTCTALDAYAIKFTTSGKACGSAPVPTSAGQIYHFLKVTVNGTSVTVTPINSLGQSFDVQNYSFTSGAETTDPSTPTNLSATVVSGTRVNLSWSASSDNTGVRGYGIYRNGTLVGTVDKTTLNYSDVNLLPATSYTYRVDAFDGSGNHSPRSSSRTVTTQSTATYTFAPIADAYVAGDVTATNYGSSTTLKADGSPVYRSYLRFAVGDTSGPVTNATLRLYTTSTSSIGYQVKRVNSQSWEEGAITYANSPAVGSTIGSSGSIAAGSWTSVDVTSLITGNGTYDLALTTTVTAVLNFNSRDASSNQPQLVIQTSAGGGPTSTPGPTPTASRTPTNMPTVTRTPTRTPTATSTVSSGNVLTFTTVADARVVETSPATNYGTTTTLTVDSGTGTGQTSYIRFNANGISQPIQNVKLRVFCTTNGTANGPAVYLANNAWTESGTGGITWNTQPALLSGVMDNAGAFGTNTWVEYDVTSMVLGNGTYTFALVADGTDGVTFSSREGTTPSQLVVTLSIGTPTRTATPPIGANLVLNPGFEAQGSSTADAVNWTEGTNHVRDSDKFHTGGWSLHSTYRSTGTDTHTTAPIVVNPNTTYTYSGYIWRTDSTGAACLDMADIVGELQLCTTTSGSWQFLSGIWNSGLNTSVTLRLITDGSPTGDIWFDNISLLSPDGSPTNTLVSTEVATLTPAPTIMSQTPTSTPTATLVPATAVPTDTPTSTSIPTLNTPAETDTPTFTLTPTATDLPAETETPTITPTPTLTSLATDTLTFTPTSTATATATINPEITFITVADARVVQSSPGTNYGNSTTLQADGGTTAAQTSYIRFTAIGISEPIQSVKLHVFCTTNATTNGPAVYLADNSWIESGSGGVTWNTQPALLGEAFDNKGALATSTWVEYDVTALVSGDGAYTFALVADSMDGVTFSSREGGTPPQLVVTFVP